MVAHGVSNGCLSLVLIVQCCGLSSVDPLLSTALVRSPLMQVSQLACCVVQEALNVKPNTTFVGCSDKVAAVLGPDVMKSVKSLIPDLLAALPVLLYQGQSICQRVVQSVTSLLGPDV